MVESVRDDRERRAAAADVPTQTVTLPAERDGVAAEPATDDAVDAARAATAEQAPSAPPSPAGPRRLVVVIGTRVRAMSPTGWYIAALAVVAAGIALLVKYLLFPHLSINNDEALYRLQAQTLASGHLFPRAGTPVGSFAPWLAKGVHGHYVLKYTPFVPALFALSLLVTGGFGTGLAVIAALAVVVTYRLGLALFDDRRVAAVAATLFATSPLVVLLDGMLLAYLPVLVMIELAVLGLLRGVAAARAPATRRGWRDRRGWALVGAGLAAGIAAAVRPFDVLTLLAPLAVWALVTARGGRWWLAGRAGVGLAVPAALLLAFDAAATGSPFQLPFTYLESEDKMGFGVRRLYPTDRAHHFTLPDGLSSVGLHLFLLGGWACGGVVLLGCAIGALARRRIGGAGVMLGVGALVFLAGYVAFWGAWNAAFLWGGIRFLGPFYVLPVLAVLVQLGARGLVDLAAWRPKLGAAAVTVIAGLTCLVLATAVPANVTLSRHDRDLDRIVDALPGRPLIFLSVDPIYLMHPTSLAANPPGLDGRMLWAVTRGGAPDEAVLANNAGRPAYLLRIPAAYNRTPDAPAGARLERLANQVGDEVTLDVTIDPSRDPAKAARLVLTSDAGDISYPIDPTRPVHAQLVITPSGTTLRGLTPSTGLRGTPRWLHHRKAPAASKAGTRTVGLALYTTPTASGREQWVDRELAPTVVGRDGQVTVLASTGQVSATPDPAAPPIHLTAAR
ncbi:phospholipid carrier-dependent glycosyltransferase [Frankia sp. AgB1.9]|nr:phospholipid carrier-dependent glycosyltransferase [Frankia sp. AgW1.1]MBL7551829.1 phospholipid carrier-dependent glycosyltransferase [Frankia sp. AgB1.9]MBL7622660.1 phospholipid carrier-dependent glycosyltransferase [Frankia sp. AgB1.8]